MLKKPFVGILVVALLLTFLIAGIDINVTKAVDYGSSGTPVGGIIWENTTWTLENSPYIITDTVQIPENVTLKIEPGVTVMRPTSGDMFLLHGRIEAHGTISNKIVFDGGGNSNFFSPKKSVTTTFLNLSYCIIRNGLSLWPPTGYSTYGSFSIKYSELINLASYSYVWYPERDVHIEYNTFINTTGFSIGNGVASVYIRYNLFKGGIPDPYRGFYSFIENWNSGGTSQTIVKYNSFIATSGIVLRLPPGYSGAAMTATENYWGTTDTEVIDTMIYDKNDDITCAGFIEYLPILSEPHPNTPKISSTIYVDDDNTAGPWDGTVEHPYQNITQGLKHTSDNDIIFVFSGTYYENVVVNKTLCLTAENREDTIIDARGIGDVLRIEVDNVTVSNFTMRYGDNGIYLSGSHGSTIRNNNVTTNHHRGILAMYSTGNNFEANIVNDNRGQAGIDLAEGCIDNIIQDNIITNNGVGIYLRSNNGNNTVQGNKVQSNSRGINVGFSNGNMIVSNIITSSGDYGILFESSSGNDVCGNLIANNRVAGIKFAGGNDNKIYHNNFIDNADQVLLSISFNIWDDGYPSGGNYWSDYAGVDIYRGPYQNETGSDGIGDTPYIIDADNQDRYPLMYQWPDMIPPTTTDDYDKVWHTTDFTITLVATDVGRGVAETYYKINDGPIQNVGAHGQPRITTESANNKLEYWSVDNAGNEELPHKVLTGIKLDKTAPTIEIPSRIPENDVEPDQEVKVSVNVTDFESGVKNVTLSCLNMYKPVSNFTTVKDLNITLCLHRTTYYYKDSVSGNVTITYLNGTGFEGIFSIYVVPIFGGYGRTDYHSNPVVKNGFAEFYLPSPVFVYGPGNYTIGIADLSTVEGYVIAANLWDPRVQVEVKDDSMIWIDLPMTFNSTTGLYEATIPGQGEGTLVRYKISAYDKAGNYRVEDKDGEYYVYTVIPEFTSTIILPLFMLTTLIATILLKKKRKPRTQLP